VKHFCILVLTVLIISACSRKEGSRPSIVPYPSSLKTGKGHFELQASTKIMVNDHGRFTEEIDFFQSLMEKSLGKALLEGTGKNSIEIIQSDTFTIPESYFIQISRKKVILSACDPSGIFYAMETLRQLLPPKIEKGSPSPVVSIPAMTIYDRPVYFWRGMHQDVSRHFFSIGYLKRYVDLMALYKMNRLHLHLTDDQGWRMEIKKYPELTEKGAWRIFNSQDSVCMQKAREDSIFSLDKRHIELRNGKQVYGGFYTQEQIRELIKYARQRHVVIVPEIDMPGHMRAALQIYPGLACTGKAGWGKVFSTPLCPAKEEVYSFVEDILSEIVDLFPSKYVHIGADEVEKTTWEESEACKQLMKREGYSDIDQLQGYFVKRIANFLKEKGKEVIVWDDALEGGIDSSLLVMYWRNWVAGVPEKAVENGNDLIMAPGNPLYFSNISTTLFDIYHMKLTGAKFPADKMDKIMGLQACVWTETVPSEQVSDALVFPKIMALAERCWTNPDILDWESFKFRVKPQLARLDQLGVNYSYNPTNKILPFMEIDTIRHRIGVTFETEITNPVIYYTTDGTLPTMASERYDGKFYVTGGASICAAVFVGNKPGDPVLRKQIDYHKAIGKPVVYHMPWNNAYPAGDAGALTDGYRGGESYSDGRWQGFTNNLDVTVDLGKLEELHTFSATFMQIIGPGVFMPGYVRVSVSSDGNEFKDVLQVDNDVPANEKELVFKNFSGSLNKEMARFVHVVAYNTNNAFLFVDELVIN
jgi:hexosaminidase